MDTSPSVYDHPVLRGSASSLLVVFSLWSLILIQGNDTAPFARVLQPATLNDFLWLGGALTAAHLTGLVSGYLRTSWLWLALSIGLTPLYWLALAGGCAVAGASVCGSPGVSLRIASDGCRIRRAPDRRLPCARVAHERIDLGAEAASTEADPGAIGLAAAQPRSALTRRR